MKLDLSIRWQKAVLTALIAGVLLRTLFVQDMEYKEDEEYNFVQTQLIGNSIPWPWYGIPSGVYLVNPGMSIWVFAVLAKLFGIHEPTALATAVQLFAMLGMSLIIPFVVYFLKSSSEKKTWLWAFLLAMVNPFLVHYQRKLWPEPFLPFFTMLTLMGWWKRNTLFWAFLWGMIGAWLGQIHMSGFFFSAALFIWTLCFDRKVKVHWKGWFFGSLIGALPLIPWLIYVLQNPISQSMSRGWDEIVQLKYWVFWLSNPTGIHLGNTLGINRGPSHWNQISDFIRYPLIGGQATYGVAAAHIAALGAALWIYGNGIRQLYQRLWDRGTRLRSIWIGNDSDTAFVQNSIFWGCGILMTFTGVMIRRYYMNITFPLEFILLARCANPETSIGKKALFTLWIAELFISAHFVGYIHVNEGSITGDYGKAYHLVNKDKTLQNPK